MNFKIVKITKCSVADMWYDDFVKNTFEVIVYKFYYQLRDSNKIIFKNDAKTIHNLIK